MKNLKIFLLHVLLIVTAIFTFSQQSNAQSTPDPGIAGTYLVSNTAYNLGDLAYKPPSFPDTVEVRGSVFYPTMLSAGPFPVLFFLHGRHETCYETSNPSNTNLIWPCPSGWQSITSFTGYDYLAKNMASHGYIVISISCNAINATDNSVGDYGMQGRAELLQHHLDLWNTWNTLGGSPFGTLFVGRLDMQNIGTMGHSRGGEGVVLQAQLNQSLGSPYGIKAVLTLAPVDFLRHVLHHIPLLDVSPYCDGDVSNLQGVHFYDDSRYTDTTDFAPKHTILFMGANHNFFNTVWTPGSYIAGGADDWYYTGGPFDPQCGPYYPGNKRFDTTKQKKALLAYMAAFYRVYIGHENCFSPILTVDDIVPPASTTLDSSNVFVAYHPSIVNRLDVNRTDSINKTIINTLQDTVTESGLPTSVICGGGLSIASCGIATSSNQEPHRGNTTTIGLAQMNIQWNDTSEYYENTLPIMYQNLSQYQNLIFRASVNFHLYTSSSNLNFTIQLVDSFGNTSNIFVGDNTYALFAQPGTQSGDLPKIVFNTISVPLSAFGDIDMLKIRKIRFLFNVSATGAILISDLAFSNPPCNNFHSFFTDSIATGYKVIFNNNTISANGDSLTWMWNFGDTSTGLNDTSSLQNPFHIYHGAGTYIACLYAKSYRKNSFVCQDTFCRTILLLPPVGITETNENAITIIPNPAKNYVKISGTEKSDIFALFNVYGQEVYNTNIEDSIINLPQNLSTGIYYVVITTKTGKVYKKLLITN